MRRAVAAGGFTLFLIAAACGSDEANVGSSVASSVASSTTAATAPATSAATDSGQDSTGSDADPEASSSTSTTPVETTEADGNEPAEATEAGALRSFLGADRLVLRVGTDVVASSDQAEFGLDSSFPGVHADHLVDDGTILDFTGQPVCPDFELVGDYLIVEDVISQGGSPVAIVEDRRTLAIDVGAASTPIPRWRHDCGTGEVTELPSTSSVEWTDETSIVTTTTPGGLTLVTEWGTGDSPARLSTGAGTLLIDTDALAYDYVLAPDEATIYATTYSGTGAASPPDGVIAIDVETGAERWRRDVGGYPWILNDRLVIEEVDLQLSDLGLFVGREIVIVDPTTGVELDRTATTSRIVGLS